MMDAIPPDIRAAAQVVMGKFNGGGGALHDLIACALFAERVAQRERDAAVADAYADENWQMTMDTIKNDPILHRQHKGLITAEEDARADSLAVDSCIHSSMHHAAKHIANAIRAPYPLMGECR